MAGGMGNQMNQIPGNQMSMNAMNVHSPQINPMNNLNVQSPQMNPMPSMNVQSPQMNAMNNMNVQSPMSSMVSMSMNPPTQSQMNVRISIYQFYICIHNISAISILPNVNF